MESPSPLLQAQGLSKRFSGVHALDAVSLEVRAGEVHCLMGENGAGKSTLLRLLAGLMAPDAGEIRIEGRPCRFSSPHDASRHGVAMIHQELTPFPDLSVAENIGMGREPVRGPAGWIDRRRLRAEAAAVLGRLGAAHIAPDRLVRDLSISEAQVVEIAKAVAGRARLLIMDEPTSSLSAQEEQALFRLIGELRAQGTGIVYVSHKMDEVFRIGDRVTVLRDGRWVATSPLAQMTEAALIAQMVGRPLSAHRRPAGAPRGEPLLAVRGLSRAGKFSDVTFALHRGEVLGMAGLMGAGRSAVAAALYGLEPADGGELEIRGRPARVSSPRDALRQRIGFVSEDRKQVGLVIGASVKHNITLSQLARCCRRGLIRTGWENALADENIARFGIRAAGRDQTAGQLSGGNQQKVVMAKVLLGDPEILLLDEPTRGIDVGAKQEIYGLIAQWAAQGRGILLISSELPELLALSDRVLVMRAGRIVADLPHAGLSQGEILRHAMPA